MQEAALAIEEGRVQDVPLATLQQCDIVGRDALRNGVRMVSGLFNGEIDGTEQCCCGKTAREDDPTFRNV